MAEMTLGSDDIEKVKHKVITEWDRLKNPTAPLSESQLQVIDRIAEVVKYRPLPIGVSKSFVSTFVHRLSGKCCY